MYIPLLPFKITLKDISFHIPIKSLGLYLSPKYLFTFLSNLYISTCTGKAFKFIVFKFLENALNLGIFTHAPLPSSSPLKSHAQVLTITNYSFSQTAFFRKSISPNSRKELIYFLYQNSIIKYEDEVEH